jgi:hypothetical protein
MPAAKTNVDLQPTTAATVPLTVRERRMPASRPPITVPMAPPRSLGATRPAAKGTIIWGTDEANPRRKLAAASVAKVGAAATARSMTAEAPVVATMSPRRSRPSPRGTSSTMPSA